MRDAPWTFYGREGCDCCSTAAGFLMAGLRSLPVTVRMVDVHGHAPRDGPHALPAFTDPRGTVVWEGSFDSEATRMALEAWGVVRLPRESDGVAAT